LKIPFYQFFFFLISVFFFFFRFILSCSCCVCTLRYGRDERGMKNFLKRITWVKWHGKNFRLNQIKEKLSCTCICSHTPLHCLHTYNLYDWLNFLRSFFHLSNLFSFLSLVSFSLDIPLFQRCITCHFGKKESFLFSILVYTLDW